MKKKVIKLFINILICVYIFILLSYGISIIGSYYNTYGINSIGSIGIIAVNDNTYPGYKAGDMVFIRYIKGYEAGNDDIVLYEVRHGKLSFGKAGTIGSSIIIGKPMGRLPYCGVLMSFAKKGAGIILLIVIPLISISLYLFTMIIDSVIDNSRHRRRIKRKRRRRKERYNKEGLYGKRGAVI